jgi:hypothetical protein
MRLATSSTFPAALTTCLALAALSALGGCGGSSSGLRGAHFEIPYYPGAEVTERDTGGFQAGDSFSSLESYDYTSWTLSTGDPMEKVMAFYTSKFPKEVEESKQEDAEFGDEDDSEFTFTFQPEGANADDHVEITISSGKIEIMEVIKRK